MLACCAAAFILSTPAPFTGLAGGRTPAHASHVVEVVVPRIVSTRMIDRGDGVMELELKTNDPALRARGGKVGITDQRSTRTPAGRVVTTVRQTFVTP